MNILSYFIHELQFNLWNILFKCIKLIRIHELDWTAGTMPIYVLSMQHLISWTNTTMKRQKFGVQWIIFPLIYSVIHTQNKDIDSTPLNRDSENLTFLWVARLLQSYSHSSPSVQPASGMNKDFISSFLLFNQDTKVHNNIFFYIKVLWEIKMLIFFSYDQSYIITNM